MSIGIEILSSNFCLIVSSIAKALLNALGIIEESILILRMVLLKRYSLRNSFLAILLFLKKKIFSILYQLVMYSSTAATSFLNCEMKYFGG